MTKSDHREPMSREWNYFPQLPLANTSIFQWPPKPSQLVRWLFRNWFTLSERVLMVILAVALWYYAYPSLETAKTFAIGWIFQTWAINMALMIFIAGGLHWYFYIRRGQEKRLKFDHRDQTKNNRLWKFSNQVQDNMFWSLTSGVGQINPISGADHVDDGQWVRASHLNSGQSGLVCIWLDPVAGMVGLSFLLGSPAVTCAVPV